MTKSHSTILKESFKSEMAKVPNKTPPKDLIPMVLTSLLWCNFAILERLESIENKFIKGD